MLDRIKEWFRTKERYPAEITITPKEIEEGQLTEQEITDGQLTDEEIEWGIHNSHSEMPPEYDGWEDIDEIELDFDKENPTIEPPEIEL